MIYVICQLNDTQLIKSINLWLVGLILQPARGNYCPSIAGPRPLCWAEDADAEDRIVP